MGETTKIEWTHHTFNPWIGCTKVHAGCTNCYAEAQNKRWGYNGGSWGKGAPRKVTSDSNWREPLKWARAAAKAGERRRVFCASLADVLDEDAPAEAQARLWRLIRETGVGCATAMLGDGCAFDAAEGMDRNECANCGGAWAGLDWLLLTKRPERWELVPEDVRPLVWLGTSVSDQATAEEWVPRLLAARGFAKRFVSAEPLVGPVNLSRLQDDELGATWNALEMGLDWVIVGGESGHAARPFDIGWARLLVAECAVAGVSCFVKQLGAHAVDSISHFGDPSGDTLLYDDRKGGDPSEWPADLRVREFPGVA
jgi:protein gp37